MFESRNEAKNDVLHKVGPSKIKLVVVDGTRLSPKHNLSAIARNSVEVSIFLQRPSRISVKGWIADQKFASAKNLRETRETETLP